MKIILVAQKDKYQFARRQPDFLTLLYAFLEKFRARFTLVYRPHAQEERDRQSDWSYFMS